MSRLFVMEGKIKHKLSQAKIKNLKKNLRANILVAHVSLREMASSPWFYNNQITFQTLGRFANERDYIPASFEICKVLDILADPNPYRGLPKWYQRTPEALNFFNTKRMQIKQMSDEAKRQRQAQ